MGQDGANRYSYVYNHPTTFIDPTGFDGDIPDFDFDFDAGGTFYSYPDMSVGTAGYYTPPADISSGMSQMSYAGGQSYAGDSGQWGAAGAYCADSYSSYMSAQYGALGDTLAAQQLNVFRNPVPSWYPDDSSLAYAQNACLAFATGCAIAATYGAAAAAGPAIYSTLSGFGTTAATSPELVAAGAGAAQYAVANAPELESLAPEVSSVAAEGAGAIRYTAFDAGPLTEDIASTFRGGSYTERILEQSLTLYRGWGGDAGPLGRFWTTIAPNGPLQLQLDSALVPSWGNTLSGISTIEVPAGTTIYEGFAASQSMGYGSLLGGGSQVYIPTVNPSWLMQ